MARPPPIALPIALPGDARLPAAPGGRLNRDLPIVDRPGKAGSVKTDPARVRLFVPSRAWGGRRRREILFAAAAIAILVHVLVVLAILATQRLSARPQAVPPPAQEPPTIEMIEDDAKYAGGSKPTPPATPAPPSPPAPLAPPKQAGAPIASDLPPPPTPVAPDQTTPPEAPRTATPQPEAPAPTPQPRAEQPDVELNPADGLGYGHQDDPAVIPASPDSKANKMPAYPRAAGRRGEEGTVEMLVRIAADGSVRGVDLAVSSGHPDLDDTALRAVSHWTFRPAVRDGVAVPTQMMQVFHYHIDR